MPDPDPDRAGSISAVCCPRLDQAIIWSAPEMALRVAEVQRPRAMTLQEFVVAAAHLGGTPGDTGTFRVLD
ncbi:MAG: hypothetical protein WBG76_00290, partial [Ornithinimicrobium sp.]